MIAMVSGFGSGKTVSYQIVSFQTPGTPVVVVAYTSTGVWEYQVDATAAKSVYYVQIADDLVRVNADGTAFEGIIEWKTNDAVPLTGVQIINRQDAALLRPTGAVVADAGNTAQTFKTNFTVAITNYWNNAFLKMTSGALVGEVARIQSYDGTTKFITLSTALTSSPAASDTFKIISE